jgi:hypothetical protein
MADDMLGFLADLCVIRLHIIDHAAGGGRSCDGPEGARARRPSCRCEWLVPARSALPALLRDTARPAARKRPDAFPARATLVSLAG